MNLLVLQIAWRNIWRNSRRTGITLATMVICVGINVWLITFADGSHEEMIRSSLNLGLGSLQVNAATYQEDKSIEKAILNPQPIVDIASELEGLQGVSTRLNAFGLVSHSSASQGAAIVGVDPVGETSISIIDEKIRTGNWLPATIENPRELPIAIGVGMAQKLGVDIGDRLFLTIQRFTGDTGYAVYFVEGIFKTGMTELDKSVVYVPIGTLRDVMAVDVPRFSNAVHEVTVVLDPKADYFEAVDFVSAGIADLQAADPSILGENQEFDVLNWEEIQPGLKAFVELDSLGMYIFILFIFLVVAAGVMNTFLMSVFERIREFGILMSLGTRPIEIFKLVMTESIIVGIIGAFAGLGLGLIGFWINSYYPISYGSMGEEMADIMSMDWSIAIYPSLIWANVFKAIIAIIVVTFLAALWPAIKAALLKPVEALRHV